MQLSNFELYGFISGFLGVYILTNLWAKYLKIGLDSINKKQTIHILDSYRIGGIINILIIILLIYIFTIFDKFPIFLIFFIPLIAVTICEDLFQNISGKS